MKKSVLLVAVLMLLLSSSTYLSGQTYVGSETCKPCHSGQHENWIKSGHPYKIQKLENGQPPVYPEGLSSHKVVGSEVDYMLQPGVPQPPKGYTWSEIGFVLGGYHSNARFLDTQGFKIHGDSAQYNLITDKWKAYNGTEPSLGNYTYSCYKCHTTGASPDKTAEFEAYPGIEGSWVETGVGCEGCHGPGSEHASNISVKPPKEGYDTCNNCHARDRGETYEWNYRVQWRTQTVNDVPTGFIRHREQGDMMKASKHGVALECVTCHSPHKSVYYEMGGLKESINCQTCHQNKEISGHGPEKTECVDCHMPFAAKNGDVKTPYISEQSAHYWNIITEPITMFANLDTIAGKYFIATDENDMSGITLDYACLQCHVDKDVNWAASKAKNMHDTGVSVATTSDMKPSGYMLAQNFPNPFNPSTTIAFSLPKLSFVTINIYSANGRLVKTLVEEKMDAGRHSVVFDAANFASGMYVYSITADKFKYNRKMLFVK